MSIAFFAFTTVLAYYYMSEVNLTYFNRWVKSRPIRRGLVWALRILIIVSVIVGATTTPGSAWALGDIGVGTTAWLNIIAILFLQAPAIKVLKDYEKQKKAGKDPEFDPEAVGIKNADFWVDRKNARAAAQAASKQAAGENAES